MDHSLRSRSLFYTLKGKNQEVDSLTWDYCRYILGLKRLVDFPVQCNYMDHCSQSRCLIILPLPLCFCR